MPIYEYRCEKCGSKFEVFVRSSDSEEELRCEHCGHTGVKRVFSAFATSGETSSVGGGASSCGSSGFG